MDNDFLNYIFNSVKIKKNEIPNQTHNDEYNQKNDNININNSKCNEDNQKNDNININNTECNEDNQKK